MGQRAHGNAALLIFGLLGGVVIVGCNSSPNEKPSAAKSSTTKPTASKAPATKPAAPKRLPAARLPNTPRRSRKTLPANQANRPRNRLLKNRPLPWRLPSHPRSKAASPRWPNSFRPDPLDNVMPSVLMTNGEKATCKVLVGDTLPNFELADTAGKQQSLQGLLGEKLTVVLFWNAKQIYALEELGDLQRKVVNRFGARRQSRGHRRAGSGRTGAHETAAERKATYPELLDTNGEAFAQVATGRVPRTYLVDATGKILWLDIEYSRSTRRDLMRAIRATLSANQ